MTRPYTLRQTTPDQVTTHWDTCYTLHSACMERKVETMTARIAILAGHLRDWHDEEHSASSWSDCQENECIETRAIASDVVGDGRKGE